MLKTPGWQQIGHALDACLQNDLKHNCMPPISVIGNEGETLKFSWTGGWTEGDRVEVLRARFDLAEAYACRVDRVTGTPVIPLEGKK